MEYEFRVKHILRKLVWFLTHPIVEYTTNENEHKQGQTKQRRKEGTIENLAIVRVRR